MLGVDELGAASPAGACLPQLSQLWIEQPENIPTAVALKPYPRSVVAPLLKKYQLFK